MPTIVQHALESAPGADPWPAIADRIATWAGDRALSLRDAIVLLPFAQLLAPARQAFAARSAWMPRIETTRTLAASLGPSPSVQAGQLSFDSTLDALSAQALLRAQPWAAAWSRRDPRAFANGVNALVATAQALAQAAFALPIAARAAHWAAARESMGPVGGPGATERLLSRIALEWASLAGAPTRDRLFGLASSAWIVVQAGGADPFTASVLADSDAPSLLLDLDDAPDAAFDAVVRQPPPAFAFCNGFEHEAQCAAAQVLAHLRRDESPVALIAADRLLVRRIRALLERHAVCLLDETGWKLSTTRAAAQVIGLLRAARPDAGTDALIDWLKSGTAWTTGAAGSALTELEASCRRQSLRRVTSLDAAELGNAATRLWAGAAALLEALSATSSQTLDAWLTALAAALHGCGALVQLQRDEAGRQLLKALHLTNAASRGGAAVLRASTLAMSFSAFSDWVDEVLEATNFQPEAPTGVAPQVVITPLARAMLRPFAAVVFPGADDRHLGNAPIAAGLLSDAQQIALGIPGAASRRAAELNAFVQLLRLPRITLMRRRIDGKEPLIASPLVERFALALAARGHALQPWCDPREEIDLSPTPIHMSAPSALALMPKRLSASSCEALRACPYRFFALHMLKVREDDELEREVEKRDYGTWLHAVLYEFHRERERPQAIAVEIDALRALGQAQRIAQGLGDADFVPFAASFDAFAPNYVRWLHARDAQGTRWQRGEASFSAFPPSFEGTEMYGEIDRIDALREPAALELIDYKTGGASGLKEKVREPFEDTQLAFYAALMRAHSDQPLRAVYLPLDGADALKAVPHREVDASAEALVDGIADDLRRLRAGAGLPALGEGAVCTTCAARGICRRDQWSEVAGASPTLAELAELRA